MDWKDELKALIAKAKAEKLWLFHNSGTLYLHPNELAAENANGRLVMSVENWRLVSGEQVLKLAEARAASAKTEYENAERRVASIRDRLNHLG